MAVSTNGNQSFSVLGQIEVAGVTAPSYKWFSLQNNVLDGSFHPIDASGVSNIGWWGNTLCDGSGVFATPPVATLTMTARTVHALRIIGDSLLNEYPVDFEIKLYVGTDVLDYTETVTGNTQVTWYKQLNPIHDAITKLTVTITKWSTPNRSVKLLSAFSPFNVVDTDDLNTSLTSAAVLNPSNTLLANADNLEVVITEANTIIANVPATESLDVVLDEQIGMTVELADTETLPISLTDVSVPTNIYTVCDQAMRQIFGMVEITYTDPYNDESLVITASETGRFTYPEELADSIITPAYKWFSLHDNVLDGSFHPMPGDQSLSVGWWGTQLSDASGVFATPPTITVSFSARALISLMLTGDSLLNCYPVDFEIRVYDASDTLLHTETVTGNTVVDWSTSITTILGVTKIVATISKINQSFSVAKITEMFTAIVETYLAEDIESIHLLEEVGYTTGSLPIGNLSANEIDITLSNTTRRFDLNNTQSTLYGYVKRNRRVRAWLGAYVGPTIEWHLMGVFWTTTWDIKKDSLVASLTARDRLELLRLTDFTTSILYVDYTLYDLFELVLLDAGLDSTEYDLDAALSGITIPYAWFEKMSHRDALQRLAGCAIIQVFCTKEGVIRVNLNLDATPTVMVTFDDDINVYDSSYPLAVAEQVNYIEVSAQKWSVGANETLYDSPEVLTLAAGAQVSRDYEFTNVPVVSIDTPIVTSDAGIVVIGSTQRAWGVTITYSNPTGTPLSVTHVKVTGTALKDDGQQTVVAQDAQLIRDDGKIKVPINHDFIQTTVYAQSLADEILATYGAARYDVSLNNRGQVALRLGDKVLVNDTRENLSVPYMVTRQNISWDGALSAVTEGKKL